MENQLIETDLLQLTKEDFASDQMVKWCPGCGDHAILKAVENVFPNLGIKKRKILWWFPVLDAPHVFLII